MHTYNQFNQICYNLSFVFLKDTDPGVFCRVRQPQFLCFFQLHCSIMRWSFKVIYNTLKFLLPIKADSISDCNCSIFLIFLLHQFAYHMHNISSQLCCWYEFSINHRINYIAKLHLTGVLCTIKDLTASFFFPVSSPYFLSSSAGDCRLWCYGSCWPWSSSWRWSWGCSSLVRVVSLSVDADVAILETKDNLVCVNNILAFFFGSSEFMI